MELHLFVHVKNTRHFRLFNDEGRRLVLVGSTELHIFQRNRLQPALLRYGCDHAIELFVIRKPHLVFHFVLDMGQLALFILLLLLSLVAHLRTGLNILALLVRDGLRFDVSVVVRRRVVSLQAREAAAEDLAKALDHVASLVHI